MEQRVLASERIDLHMHTMISDGTDTPEEILARVKEKGIGVFSITDHDAIKSSTIVPAFLKEEDPAYIAGVEFSCKDAEGKYHILGYGYDPESEGIREVVEKGHSFRMHKVWKRLDFLKEQFGFTFPGEEIDALFAMDNPGKPHIGNLMVKYGYAGSKEEAIRDYINQVHFHSEYVRPEEAIEGILKSGGIPVLAHPSYGSGDELILGMELEERVCRLMEAGLKGLEAFYSGFTDKLRRGVCSLAEKYDLYVTAGSDYHGKNKMVVLGDTGLPDEERPEGLQRFLHDVRMIRG